jgi:hypothetical protein
MTEYKNTLDIKYTMRLETILRERKLSSCMNNAKWVKLLSALVEIAESLEIVRIKLIWDEQIGILKIDSYTSYDFDFYAAAMEAMVSLVHGWCDYKEIEWLEISSANLDLVREHLQGIAQFALEETEIGLRIYGYR